MKKRIIAIAAVAIIGMSTFVACNKDTASLQPTLSGVQSPIIKHRMVTTLPIGEELNKIGDRHNASLELAFSMLPMHISGNRTNEVSIITGSIQKEYQNDISYDEALIFASHCKTVADTKSEIAKLETNVLNKAYRDVYSQIKSAVLDNTSPEEYYDRILSIFQEGIKAYPDAEQEIKTMCGIAVGSYGYWTTSENFDKWQTKANGGLMITRGFTKTEKVARFVVADIIGGTAGPAIAFLASGFEAWGWD